MQVIKLENGKCPFLSEIDNTLAAMQQYVGGYIETVTSKNGLVVVLNEEGSLLPNPPMNGWLFNLDERLRNPIWGNALIVRYSGDMFMPVTRADLRTVQDAHISVWETVERETLKGGK